MKVTNQVSKSGNGKHTATTLLTAVEQPKKQVQPAKTNGKGATVDPETAYVVSLTTMNDSQLYKEIQLNYMKLSAIAAEILRRNDGNVSAAKAWYANQLRVNHPEWKDWKINEPNTTKPGQKFHEPNRMYLAFCYHFRTDASKNGNKGGERSIETVVGTFFTTARNKAADGEWIPIFVKQLSDDERESLKRLLTTSKRR